MASVDDDENAVMSEECSRSLSEECNRSVSIPVNKCDPCLDDDIHVQAEGYCVDCNDYLCSDCYKAHKKARLSRNHVLQDKASMPGSKPNRVAAAEKCPIHNTGTLKWYCMSHDQVICDLCQATQHRKCDEIKAISEISADIFNSSEFKSTNDQFAKLKEEFGNHLVEVKENASEVENMYENVLQEIENRLKEIRNKDHKLMKSLESSCNTSLSIIEGFTSDREKMKTNDTKERAFVVQRKVQSQMKSLEETLQSVKEDNEFTKYRFLPTPPHIKSGLIGTLCETRYRRTPVKVEEINVRTSSDTRDCWISGIDRLGDNRLALADYNNSKLKVLDLTSKLVTQEIKLEMAPWDMTKIDDKNLVLTTHSNKQILFASITDKFTVSTSLNKGNYGYCQGIMYRYDNGTLIVSYSCPAKIETLDLQGTVKQTIESTDHQGTVRFGNILSIAKGPDTDTLYLSDFSSNKIHRMSRDGTILSSLSHQHLSGPRGITVGRDGRIFVCSCNTHKICELSSDLSKSEIILDEQHSIKCPCSIVCDDNGYIVYIGSINSNNIQVFMV